MLQPWNFAWMSLRSTAGVKGETIDANTNLTLNNLHVDPSKSQNVEISKPDLVKVSDGKESALLHSLKSTATINYQLAIASTVHCLCN